MPDPITQSSPQYGPYTGAITGPLTPQRQQPTQPMGYPGTAGSIVSFVDNFLKGVQSGRRTQYERSEQQKQEHYDNFQGQYSRMMADPTISPEGKRHATEIFNTAAAGHLHQVVKDSASSNKDNPLWHFAKAAAGAIGGPTANASHADYDVNDLLTISRDPQYKIDPLDIQAKALSAVTTPGAAAPVPAAIVSPASGPAPAAQSPGATVQAPAQPAGFSMTQGLDQFKAPIATTAAPPVAAQAVAGQNPEAAASPEAAATPSGQMADAVTAKPPVDAATANQVPATQLEAWKNPTFVAQLNIMRRAGIDPATTDLGRFYESLPKTAPPKPFGSQKIVQDASSSTGWSYQQQVMDSTGNITLRLAGDAPAPGSNARPGQGMHLVTPAAAREFRAAGTVYNGSDGKPIDLDIVERNGMQLQPILAPGQKTPWYLPVNPNEVETDVQGNVYLTAGNQRTLIQSGQAQAVGAKSLGTQGTQPMVLNTGPNGEQSVFQAPTTSTPVVKPVAPTQLAPSGAAPITAAPPTTAKPPARAASPSGRVIQLPGLQPAEYDRQQKIKAPIVTAANQLFGDPNNPDNHPLSSYADLANDKHAQGVLGAAFRIVQDKMANGAAGHGSIGDWISSVTGFKQAEAEALADVQHNLFQQMTPREQEAFNATMAAYGTIVGLRAITKASASASSVSRLENELPLIGINTPSSASFNDKMSKPAEEISANVRRLNPIIFSGGQTEKDFYTNLGRQQTQKPASIALAPPKSYTTDPARLMINGRVATNQASYDAAIKNLNEHGYTVAK